MKLTDDFRLYLDNILAEYTYDLDGKIAIDEDRLKDLIIDVGFSCVVDSNVFAILEKQVEFQNQ